MSDAELELTNAVLDRYFAMLEEKGIAVPCPACKGTGEEPDEELCAHCDICMGFGRVVPFGYRE